MGIVTALAPSKTVSAVERAVRCFPKKATTKWLTPRIVEVAVGLEINSYACAHLE